MFLPQNHLQELSELSKSINNVGGFLANPKLLDALSDLVESVQARQQMASDPGSYLSSKGVVLPKGAEVSYAEHTISKMALTGLAGTARRFVVTVCFNIVVNGVLKGMSCITYDSDKGFTVSVS